MFYCFSFAQLDPNVWVPIVILAVTGIGKWVYDTFQEEARQRKISQYFLFCLERLEVSAFTQITHLRRNRRMAMAPAHIEPFVIRSDPGIDLELFKEIGFKDLYESHPRKRRTEFIRVVRAVNGLHHLFQRCTRDIDDYILEDRIARAEVDASIANLQVLHSEMALCRVRSGLEPLGHQVFESLDRIMAAWQTLPDFHLVHSKKHKLNYPVQQILKEHPGFINEWVFRLNEIWQRMDAAHNRVQANERKFATQTMMSAEIFLALIKSIRAYTR